MFIATIALTALTSAPQGDDWRELGFDPARADATVVTGTVELSPGRALETAHREAADLVVRQLASRGEDRLSSRGPSWLPNFAARWILDGWSRRVDADSILEVLDRRDRVREHGGIGRSYQTALLIRADEKALTRELRRLDHAARRGAERFALASGGSVAAWSILAVLCAWLDRLSRGYMTWRLRLIFGAVGLAAPALAFLLL